MVFWICLIAGLAMAFVSFKRSFGPVWALFFNVILSVYIAVVATALLGKSFPESFQEQWARMMMFLGLSFISFCILEFIAHSFFLSNFKVAFPESFERIVNPILGFISGYIIVGSIIFAIAISPLNTAAGIKNILTKPSFVSSAQKPVLFSCNMIEAFSFQGNKENLNKAIAWLTDSTEADSLTDQTITEQADTAKVEKENQE